MAYKKAYKIDADRKVITIDDAVKRKPEDDKDIAFYVGAGYVIRHKSADRAKLAKERANKNNLKDSDIKKALKDNKEALDTYNKIKADKNNGGFFKAKSYYLKNFAKE